MFLLVALFLIERVDSVDLPNLGLLVKLLLLSKLLLALGFDLLKEEVTALLGAFRQAFGPTLFFGFKLQLSLVLILLDLNLFIVGLGILVLDHSVSHVVHKGLLAFFPRLDFLHSDFFLLLKHLRVCLLGLDVFKFLSLKIFKSFLLRSLVLNEHLMQSILFLRLLGLLIRELFFLLLLKPHCKLHICLDLILDDVLLLLFLFEELLVSARLLLLHLLLDEPLLLSLFLL